MEGSSLYLICRVDGRLCAIPCTQVAETLRPLPVEPLPDAPPFLLGICIIRGTATPVVDLRRLLSGEGNGSPARFITLRSGDRRVAVAVSETLGVRSIPPEALADAPPLAEEALTGAISAIGTLDRELLVVLESARMVPEELWTRLEEQHA